jgi:hypothetical protein
LVTSLTLAEGCTVITGETIKSRACMAGLRSDGLVQLKRRGQKNSANTIAQTMPHPTQVMFG